MITTTAEEPSGQLGIEAPLTSTAKKPETYLLESFQVAAAAASGYELLACDLTCSSLSSSCGTSNIWVRGHQQVALLWPPCTLEEGCLQSFQERWMLMQQSSPRLNNSGLLAQYPFLFPSALNKSANDSDEANLVRHRLSSLGSL